MQFQKLQMGLPNRCQENIEVDFALWERNPQNGHRPFEGHSLPGQFQRLPCWSYDCVKAGLGLQEIRCETWPESP